MSNMLAVIFYTFIASLISNANSVTVGEITQCNNYKQCESDIVNNTFINCYGHRACQNGTFMSPASMGWLDCTADKACTKSILASKGSTFCDGASSCKDITAITSQKLVRCGGASSCVTDGSVILSRSNITCNGASSCLHSHLISDDTVKCDGQRACHATKIETDNGILCNTENSCDESKLEATNMIECASKRSCRKSNITTDKLLAYGLESALQSTISAANIEGFGSYSLSKAQIDSQGIEVMNVKLYGDSAGRNTLIICRSGSQCHLDCKHNSCKKTDYVCLEGANCRITPSECNDTTARNAQIEGVDCPSLATDFESVLFQSELEEAGEVQEIDEVTDDDLLKITKSKNKLNSHTIIDLDEYSPETAPNKTLNGVRLCDTFQSCFESTINTNITYCFAYEACMWSTTNVDLMSNSDIACYGADSCQGSTLVGIRKIECSAKWSCRDDTEIITQITSGDVKCNGLESCLGTHKSIVSIDVECNGESSCLMTNVHAFMKAQCGGLRACAEGSVVSDHEAVECAGTASCQQSEVKGVEILCSATESCKDSKLITDRVKIYSAYGASGAFIYAAKVFADGYGSVERAQIDSLGQEDMKIFLNGHLAGFGASILCRGGSRCILECEGTACYQTEFMCLSGASCKVFPEECTPIQIGDNPRIRDTDCPIWRTFLSAQQQEMVLNKFKGKQMEFVSMRNELVTSSEMKDNMKNKGMMAIIFAGSLMLSVCVCGLYDSMKNKQDYEWIK